MAKNDTPTEPIAPPVAPADATAATDTTTASGPMSALVGTPAPAAEDSLVAFLNPDAIPLVLIALLSAVILVRVVNGLLPHCFILFHAIDPGIGLNIGGWGEFPSLGL